MAALGIIEYSLLYNDSNIIEQKYPPLAEFKDSSFIAHTDATIRVETCIVGIATLSYIFCKRDDIM